MSEFFFCFEVLLVWRISVLINHLKVNLNWDNPALYVLQIYRHHILLATPQLQRGIVHKRLKI